MLFTAIPAGAKLASLPAHAPWAVKSTEGSFFIRMFCVRVSEQLLPVKTISLTGYVPAPAKVCEGCCSMLVLFTPEVGSPKSHAQLLRLCNPLTVVISVKATGLPLQCPAAMKPAVGAPRIWVSLLSLWVQPWLLKTVSVTLNVPVPA